MGSYLRRCPDTHLLFLLRFVSFSKNDEKLTGEIPTRGSEKITRKNDASKLKRVPRGGLNNTLTSLMILRLSDTEGMPPDLQSI